MKNIKDLTKQNNGLSFEKKLNQTNQIYLQNNLCFCYKKPTPICVLESKNGIITNGFFEQKSTTDYYGLIQGKYFDFDAKSVSSDCFNVKKVIRPHQINHLLNVNKHGGIAFILVEFRKEGLYYLIPIDYLVSKKTIKLTELDNKWKVKDENGMIDYLNTLKVLYAIR